MEEIKTTISEQLQHLQMLMHRASFQGFMAEGRSHSHRKHNPHRGQGRVLAILKMKPEISQKELTYLLGMSKQSLAELLSKLEKSGYITREPSEEDKRVVTIKLTDEGQNASMDDNKSEAFDMENILECLNGEELIVFSEYLDRVIKKYEEQFPGEDFEERRKQLEQFMSRHSHDFESEDFEEHGGHRHHSRGGRSGRHDRPRSHHSGSGHNDRVHEFSQFNRGKVEWFVDETQVSLDE